MAFDQCLVSQPRDTRPVSAANSGATSISAVRSREDLDAVIALMRAYAASLPVDLGYQNFDAEMADMPGKYAAPTGVLLLARDGGGRPIGCVALRPMDEPGRCEMKRLYIAPAGRGLGLGRRLVEALMIEARRIGYREICLDTLPHMDDAMGLYAKLGFAAIPPYYGPAPDGTRFLGRML